MSKSNFPNLFAPILCIGVIVCSFLSGVFTLPAIVMFTVLCVKFPSPYLGAVPLASLALSMIYGYFNGGTAYAITSGIFSLSYVLPSVLIAISYFRKYSKFFTVMNGTFGIFLYSIPIVIVSFILQFGSFSKELLNSTIDGIISDSITQMTSQISAFSPESEMLLSIIKSFEEVLYLSKPLIPAVMIIYSFISAFIAVCCVNAVLKATGVIERKSYRMMPPWQLGVFFFVVVVINTLLSDFSFIAVITASIQIILVPVYIIVAFSAIHGFLEKAIGNKIVSSIIIFAGALVFFNPIIYNLLYLIGCSYSIMYGIKSHRDNTKGGAV